MATKTVSITAAQKSGFTIETNARDHTLLIDQPTNSGGADAGPTPLEYLFFSLAGCVVTIGHIIAKQERLPVRNISVRVEGELDTDVLMGKRADLRAGFSSIRVFTTIDADMTLEEKQELLEKIDKRCPISDNIINNTPVQLVVEDIKESEIYGGKN